MGRYRYFVSAIVGGIESSTRRANIVDLVGAENQVTLTWPAVTGATGYRSTGRSRPSTPRARVD